MPFYVRATGDQIVVSEDPAPGSGVWSVYRRGRPGGPLTREDGAPVGDMEEAIAWAQRRLEEGTYVTAD